MWRTPFGPKSKGLQSDVVPVQFPPFWRRISWQLSPLWWRKYASVTSLSVPRRPWINSRIVEVLVSRIASITNLPAESRIATEIVAWCTSRPIFLASFMRALLVVGGDANDQNLLQKGALL